MSLSTILSLPDIPDYHANDAPYGTHRLIAEQIGVGKRVLDVGCNKGFLKTLAPENIFYGIDYSPRDLAAATAAGYTAVFPIDINHYEAFVCDTTFDVMVFADVLEHLLYPQKVLDFFVSRYLSDNGVVIISLPNVAHISIRWNFLCGNFFYTDSGILDRTHLHLYTLASARQFITDTGLDITRELFSSNRFGKLLKYVPQLGPLGGYNLIFVCQKKKLS